MQAETTIETPIECCGVICDDTRLVEVEDGRVAVLIPRADIQRITLRHGVQAPHPILQFIVGVAITSLAYFPIRHLIQWARFGGTLFSLELGAIAVAVIGVWLMVTAFRRGLFFEIDTAQGIKRLAFQKRPEPSALNSFVKSIEKRYGLRVEKR